MQFLEWDKHAIDRCRRASLAYNNIASPYSRFVPNKFYYGAIEQYSSPRCNTEILRPLWLPRIHCIAPQGTSRPAVTRLVGTVPRLWLPQTLVDKTAGSAGGMMARSMPGLDGGSAAYLIKTSLLFSRSANTCDRAKPPSLCTKSTAE